MTRGYALQTAWKAKWFYMINNTEDQINIRRAQDTLVNVGTGVILFGSWEVIKVMLTMIANRAKLLDYMKSNIETVTDGPVFSDTALFLIFFSMAMVFYGFGLVSRIIIGRSAIAEGKGKKTGSVYLVLTAVMILIGVSSFWGDLLLLMGKNAGAVGEDLLLKDVSIVSLFIELTSLVMLIEMAAAAIKVKRYKRRQRRLQEKGMREKDRRDGHAA